jgi:hypothetical protein
MLSACGSVVVLPEQPKVLLSRSQPQTLSIENTHGSPVRVLPCNPGDPAIDIPAGGTVSLEFRVLVAADLKPVESRWYPRWFEVEDTALLFTEAVDGPCFLKAGVDSVIELQHQAAGRGNEIRLNFRRCPRGDDWRSGNAPAATFSVSSDQIAGIPIRLCPKLAP